MTHLLNATLTFIFQVTRKKRVTRTSMATKVNKRKKVEARRKKSGVTRRAIDTVYLTTNALETVQIA